MTVASAFVLLTALAVAAAPVEASIEESSAAPQAVPGMPDPLSPEWDPPPGPVPKPAPLVNDAWLDSRAPPAAGTSTRPTTHTQATLPEPALEPQLDARWSKRVLLTGIGFAVGGGVAGTVAYYSSTKTQKAQDRLDMPVLPGEMQPNRGELSDEIEKQQTIMLATAVTAAVLGTIGIVLILVGTLHKPTRRRSTTGIVLDGLRFSF